jgi:hypothetical protein
VRLSWCDGELHAFGLFSVHADAEEAQEEFGTHGADDIGTGRIDLRTLWNA